MSYKLFRISLLLSSLAYITNVSAETNTLLESISSEMKHFNKVATITKQNEHYQPYIISVFKGKDLEKLGIVNLEEALGLVPGVDMATDNIGIKTPIFRGSNPTAYGQSKLFIDGVPANNVFFDAYSEHLKMPIEIIKRIEVVRGPGSKTDGHNAYAGSINVITYAENIEGFENDDSVFMKTGSYKYGMIGFVKSYDLDTFSLTTDFSYQKDDKKLDSGPDGYASGYSLSADNNNDGDLDDSVDYDNTRFGRSGEVLQWSKTYSLGLTLDYDNTFYAKLRLLDHTQASGYGINLYLTDDKNSRIKLPNHYLEVGLKEEISDFSINIKAGAKYDAFDSHAQLTPSGLRFLNYYKYSTDKENMTAEDYSVTFDDGMYGIHSAVQNTYYQSTFFRYNGLDNHDINFGYRLSLEKTVSMVSKLTDWGGDTSTLTDYTDTFAFFEDNAERRTQAFFFEDSYHYSDNLNFLIGLNYEKTSLNDAGFEPKVSMVYQPNMSNIFKLLYSKSHRNPSWQEMYTMNNHSRQGSTEFDPERVEAYEAAYVKKINSSNYLQANIFYLKNSDQIQIVDSSHGIFDNTGKTTIYGLELEYKGNISSNDSLYMNYSYIDGEENEGNELSNIATHMVKGYYSYDLTSEFSVSSLFKYVGKKERVINDKETRTDPLKSYTKVDFTTRYDSKKYDYSIMISIKNIFNADIRFPSKPETYIDDYAQDGRNFMVTLKKEF